MRSLFSGRISPSKCLTRTRSKFQQRILIRIKQRNSSASAPSASGAAAVALPSNKSMKDIVQNLTGVARPNEIIGLLGPSGSGKTVLLNIFSDRLYPQKGSIYHRNVFVNKGVPLTRDIFGKLGAYVMQDDVLFETLTPYECLQFSANLRLSTTQEDKDRQVLRVIQDLKLKNCMNTLVLYSIR